MLNNLPPGVTPKMLDAAMGANPDYERIEEEIVAELQEYGEWPEYLNEDGSCDEAAIENRILERLAAEEERARYGWEL